jgi:hypothetical protein
LSVCGVVAVKSGLIHVHKVQFTPSVCSVLAARPRTHSSDHTDKLLFAKTALH